MRLNWETDKFSNHLQEQSYNFVLTRKPLVTEAIRCLNEVEALLLLHLSVVKMTWRRCKNGL